MKDGKLPQISKVKYLSNYCSDLPQIFNVVKYLSDLCWIFPKLNVTKSNFINFSKKDNIQWMTTSNIKREISQRRLVRCSSNLKLKINWPNKTLQTFQMKTTSNGRQLQLSKRKNLSNYCSDIPQFQVTKPNIINVLSEGYQQWNTAPTIKSEIY